MDPVSIRIITLDGQRTALSIPPSSPVSAIRTHVSQWSHLPPPSFALLYQGRYLPDDATIQETGIPTGGVVRVVVYIEEKPPVLPESPPDLGKKEGERVEGKPGPGGGMKPGPLGVPGKPGGIKFPVIPKPGLMEGLKELFRQALPSKPVVMKKSEEAESFHEEFSLSDYESIKTIVEMGFTEEQAKVAYVSGSKNVERAIEIILTM